MLREMALRIGIDIVDVAEIEDSVARFGDRYLRRIYTQRELEACADGANVRRLAAHFAAKEATFKAISANDSAIDWRSVEVQLGAHGDATVELSGPAQWLAGSEGIVTLTASVGRTRRHAAAVVVAEGSSDAGEV
jgi:holo-[acyl-carrier protein] synthase